MSVPKCQPSLSVAPLGQQHNTFFQSTLRRENS